MLELVLKRGGYQPWRTDEQIAQAVGVGTATVERVRKCFVLHGLTVSLTRKIQIALTCEDWTEKQRLN